MDASLISRSRPTSFQQTKACSMLPPEHIISCDQSTPHSRISSRDGVVLLSDTSRQRISQPRSQKAFVKRRNLSVQSNVAVPMYNSLGTLKPKRCITFSTMGCGSIPVSFPEATILGTAVEISTTFVSTMPLVFLLVRVWNYIISDHNISGEMLDGKAGMLQE